MTMENNIESVKTTNTRTSGVAIGPDGVAWVAGRDAGVVYSIAPGAPDKPVPYKLPTGGGRGAAQPAHIALETKAGAVTAVWVSDQSTGFVYRLVPGDADGHKAEKIDFGEGARLRDIGWNEKGTHVWVADEDKGLLAIDSAKKTIDTSVAAPQAAGVTHLAVADNGVWFTAYSEGKICFLDGGKKAADKDRIKEFPFGMFIVDGDNKLPSSYPTGLAIAGDRVWVVAGLSECGLWYVDNRKDMSKAKLNPATSLDKGSEPTGVAVDAAGYLWVTMLAARKVRQLTDTGVIVVRDYDLESSLPTGIAYDAHQDQVWICDTKKENQRALRLTPIDQIEVAKNGQIDLKGTPPEGFVAPNKSLARLQVSVMNRDDQTALERHLILTIDPPSVASFGGENYAVVKSDDMSGNIVLQDALKEKMPKVAASATIGTLFQVRATTRGLQKPAGIYTGRVGEEITGIKPLHDQEETVAYGTDFKNLEAQVEGAGSAHAEVVFRIDTGADCAAFTQGQSGAVEYTAKAGADGIARAGLYALEKAGDVTVSVYPKILGAGAKQTFKARHIVPRPDRIDAGQSMGIYVDQPSQHFPLTVYSGKTPVPNVVVQVIVRPVGSEAKGVHFGEKGAPDDPTMKEVQIRTDRNGHAAIGAGAEYFIISPNPGHVDVRFEVIQPARSMKAVLDINANVQREMVV
ncbi:hypothetical protein [Microbulbifer halophilus]|uniref:Uncharacterized protein n=1 Tax=Microbulbifer halophilus TaxID=453963 RepID=A0ABW5EEM6_9GAMM|nr:hypothetical protein [Microbulbifer halophilus]MCW8127599.1 hypothetical protein [Microbulbifer halophilus]